MAITFQHRKLTHALRPALACGAVCLSLPAAAATITVNTTVDNVMRDGHCSLREAVANANQSASIYADCTSGSIGRNSIVFDPAVFPAGSLTSIVLSSELVLTSSTVTTIGGGGAVAIDGGGTTRIFRNATGSNAVLQSLVIRNGNGNSSYLPGYGGAIINYGTLSIGSSTLSGSVAATHGGAVANQAGGTLTVSGTTLSGNSAASAGGAIDNAGTLSLVNSTLSGNSAAGAGSAGGGIYNSGSGTVTVTYSTFSGNAAPAGGALDNNGGMFTIAASIVASSTSGGNCAGTISDIGGNIDDGSTCAFLSSSFSNTNPLLGALFNFGGPTPTMRPLRGSPAINAIAPIAGTCAVSTDQRGYPRPIGSGCDIGSMELTAVELDRIFADNFDGTPTP